ncbi:MAG TPA: aldo/keto reductase [Candidatus Saccharimonadales bacterium]|jgi:diketogulonate reductase-like aldo/keto reductase
MNDNNTYTLNTGATIPAVGFGCWQVTPDSAARTAVEAAIDAGYRHFDTAKIYGNETGVGAGLTAGGMAREDVFVTTKLWNDDQAYDTALGAIDESLAKLSLDYVDLYLIHWPESGTRLDAWRAMQDIYASGKAKAVGVSNYTVRHLEELLAGSELVPAVNQVEFHPYIYEQQKQLLDYCADKNIIIEAYSPLARHSRDVDERIAAIAEQVGRTPSQVILRWCLQHGTVPLPRSTNPDHIRENFEIFDFFLDDEAMNTLNSMSDGQRVTSDPEEYA